MSRLLLLQSDRIPVVPSLVPHKLCVMLSKAARHHMRGDRRCMGPPARLCRPENSEANFRVDSSDLPLMDQERKSSRTKMFSKLTKCMNASVIFYYFNSHNVLQLLSDFHTIMCDV